MRPMVPGGATPGCSLGGGCSGAPAPSGSFPPLSSPQVLPAALPPPLAAPAPVAAPVPWGPGSCGMTEQCCNMADSGCCVGGEQPQQQQQCYTVWETKCRSDSRTRWSDSMTVWSECRTEMVRQ